MALPVGIHLTLKSFHPSFIIWTPSFAQTRLIWNIKTELPFYQLQVLGVESNIMTLYLFRALNIKSVIKPEVGGFFSC